MSYTNSIFKSLKCSAVKYIVKRLITADFATTDLSIFSQIVISKLQIITTHKGLLTFPPKVLVSPDFLKLKIDAIKGDVKQIFDTLHEQKF